MDPLFCETPPAAPEEAEVNHAVRLPANGARRTAKSAARIAGSVVTYSAAPVLKQAEAASTAIVASRALSSQTFGQTPALLQMSEPDFTKVTRTGVSLRFVGCTPNLQTLDKAAELHKLLDGAPAFKHLNDSERFSIARRVAGSNGSISMVDARDMAVWARGLLENNNSQYRHLDTERRRQIVDLTLAGEFIDFGTAPEVAEKLAQKIYGD